MPSGGGGSTGAGGEPGGTEGEGAPVYGLTVLGPGAGPLRQPGLPGRGGHGSAGLGGQSPGPGPAGEGGFLQRDPGRRRQHGWRRLLRRHTGGPVQPGRLHRHAQQRRHLPGRRRRRRPGQSDRRLAHRRLAERSLRPGPAGRHRRAGGGCPRFVVAGSLDGDLRRRRGLAPIHGGGRRAGLGGGQPGREHAKAGDHHPQRPRQLLPGRSRRRRLAPGRPDALPGRLRHRPGHGGASAAVRWHGPADLCLRGDRQPGGPGGGIGLGQRQQSDARAILHPERHGAQPGHGSVGGDDPPLLPLVKPDHLDPGYASRHRCGERPGRIPYQCRVNQSHRPVE